MEFIPDVKKADSVPYFDDVDSTQGWQGQTTGKSIEVLKSEIALAVSHLGGMVNGFQKGIFMTENLKREGFRIHYTIETSNGTLVPGKIEIAALPVKPLTDYHRGRVAAEEKRKEQSLKMALYMFRDALNGLWFLQQLSPGYAPLMPWMMGNETQTISQIWSESSIMSNLLPPGGTDFVDGEIEES